MLNKALWIKCSKSHDDLFQSWIGSCCLHYSFFSKNGQCSASFPLFSSFYTIDRKQINVHYKRWPMIGFEPRTSGVAVTALSTEPQPLPYANQIFYGIGFCFFGFFIKELVPDHFTWSPRGVDINDPFLLCSSLISRPIFALRSAFSSWSSPTRT